MKNLIKNLPETPGIYKMKDEQGNIIYIGKAKNLRKRINSYFTKDYKHSTRTQKLIESIKNIEVIQTDTELEALILENNLIKDFRPKYNILMKDDKSYVYIKLNLAEDFPRISVLRAKEIEGQNLKNTKKARYFGPKTAASKVYDTLRLMKKLFPFRQCALEIKSKKGNLIEVTNKVIKYPCLEYSIKQCSGPCIGAITPDEYKKIVQQITDFLNGKNENIELILKQQMTAAAEKKLFEKAARIRNKLFSLQQITEHQKITDIKRQDTDIINYVIHLERIYFNVLIIRNGRLIDQESFIVDAIKMSKDLLDLNEALESFLLQYYEKTSHIPKEIFIPHGFDALDTLEKWLSDQKGEKVRFLIPQKGEKNKLLELSLKNAVFFANQHRIKWMTEQKAENALNRLREILNLKNNELKRIEGFDVSHLNGNETVGSMVVFEKGIPKQRDYRRFKMRTIKKPDDCASMEEILTRRFKYIAIIDKSIKIRPPNKKDFESIQKTIKSDEHINAITRKKPPEKLEKKHFLAAKKNNRIVAFGRLLPLDNKISIISSLWMAPENRGKRLGYLIIKKLVKRSKLKRVYININKTFESYYAEFGFSVLHNIPEALLNRQLAALKILKNKQEKYISMVYDVKKYAIDPSFAARPDLIVIDGGKGQLRAALNALKQFNLNLPVISLAKCIEEIFIPQQKKSIQLEEGDETLKLLQRIRDEAHRFAITFQRDLHSKAILQ